MLVVKQYQFLVGSNRRKWTAAGALRLWRSGSSSQFSNIWIQQNRFSSFEKDESEKEKTRNCNSPASSSISNIHSIKPEEACKNVTSNVSLWARRRRFHILLALSLSRLELVRSISNHIIIVVSWRSTSTLEYKSRKICKYFPALILQPALHTRWEATYEISIQFHRQ